MALVEERASSAADVLQFGPACAARVMNWNAPGGRIEVITLRGLITLGQLAHLNGHLAEIERRRDCVAAVLLLTQALIAASPEEMANAEAERVRAGDLHHPVALVVAQVNLADFRRYAWAMANMGVGRYVFSDCETVRALRWARAMGWQASAERQWKARATRQQKPSGG